MTYPYKLYTLNNQFIEETDIEPWVTNFTGIIVDYDGDKYWFKNGLLHKEDGPAYEYLEGHKGYYINGKHMTKEKHDLLTSIMKLKKLL